MNVNALLPFPQASITNIGIHSCLLLALFLGLRRLLLVMDVLKDVIRQWSIITFEFVAIDVSNHLDTIQCLDAHYPLRRDF